MAKLPSTVWKLGWVSFFADVSSEMVYPLISLFLVGALGAPASVLGVVEGVAESVVSLMKGWSGIGSDRRKARLPYVRFGYGLSALGKPLLGLATAWPMAVLARCVDRVGKGLRTTARDALLSDAAGPEQRGAAFGLHRTMDTAGALVGVGVAALLVWSLGENLTKTQFALIFFLAGIPGLISLAFTLGVKESKPNLAADRPYQVREAVRALPRSFWFVAVAFAAFAFANSSDTFLLLYGKESGLSPLGVIGAYALYNVTFMISSYPAGKLSDRVGRWPLIFAGWLLYALVYGALGLNLAGLPPLLLLYGVYMGLSKAVGTALVADQSPPEYRGTAMGLFYLLAGAATLLGNIAAGQVWDHFGARTMFGASAILAVFATVIACFAVTRLKSQPSAT